MHKIHQLTSLVPLRVAVPTPRVEETLRWTYERLDNYKKDFSTTIHDVNKVFTLVGPSFELAKIKDSEFYGVLSGDEEFYKHYQEFIENMEAWRIKINTTLDKNNPGSSIDPKEISNILDLGKVTLLSLEKVSEEAPAFEKKLIEEMKKQTKKGFIGIESFALLSKRIELFSLGTLRIFVNSKGELGYSGDPRQINVNDSLEQTIDCLKAGNYMQTMKINFTKEGSAIINADPNILVRVWLNLATNAVEARQTTGTKLDVSTKTVMLAGKRFVEISFADNGPGIKTDGVNIKKKEDILRSGVTTKLTNKSSHGLGLAIVADIIKRLKGEISINTRPEFEGTKFTLLIPAA